MDLSNFPGVELSAKGADGGEVCGRGVPSSLGEGSGEEAVPLSRIFF